MNITTRRILQLLIRRVSRATGGEWWAGFRSSFIPPPLLLYRLRNDSFDKIRKEVPKVHLVLEIEVQRWPERTSGRDG